MMMPKAVRFIIILIFMLICVFTGPFPVMADNMIPDTENCLLCHRYPGMGRYDETGKKRILYINEEKFANSVHGKLRCKSCHIGLDQIPHTDVKPVDCSTNCHITEPSTEREFSHSNMVTKYNSSVHGQGNPDKVKPYAEDLPTCKYCHTNRMYNPYTTAWGGSEALSNETLARCKGCHTEEKWAQRFYSHFTHRMRQRRSHEEIVALCTSCHEDSTKMNRHGLESIETYKDTFHWVQLKYGVVNAPDCINCHIPIGYSAHDIRPRKDPLSPINKENRVKTCSNQGGIQECHPKATEQFATGRVHAYGLKTLIMANDNIADSMKKEGDTLLLERAKEDIPNQEVFRYTVLSLIRIFYRVLIGLTIGFMCFHQLLDYLRARKNRSLTKIKHD
jgi:hypothetical protein